MGPIIVTRGRWTAVWHGGPHIQLYLDNADPKAGDRVVANISVWDHFNDAATIETAGDVAAKLEEWVADDEVADAYLRSEIQ